MTSIPKRLLKDWGYGDADGPRLWVSRYPMANGKFQSPIDIETNKAIYDPYLETVNPLKLNNYERGFEPFRVCNDGTTLKILPPETSGKEDETKSISITGGPVHSNTYMLDHFHFHWGSQGTKGSEHRINGKSYDGEVHFVHWNSTNFHNMKEALSYYQGLCVIGVFLKVGDTKNSEYDKIVKNLPKIAHYHDTITVPEQLELLKLIPEDMSQYWTYPGSLTTPPFSETVTWVVLKNPVTISENQLMQLFTLKSSELDSEGKLRDMSNIYRDAQTLNGRIIRKSFKNA